MQSEEGDLHATPGSRKTRAENAHRDPILQVKCIRYRGRGWDRGNSWEFLVGLCRSVLKIVTLQTKKRAIFHTRSQTRGLILESPGNLKTFALGPL